MDEFDHIPCEKHLLETQNTHKLVQNLKDNSTIEELSWYVNHLTFLHVNRMGTWVVPLKDYTINMPELRRILRWNSFFIKKMQSKKRSVYFVNRWDGDIIFWRTQTLLNLYHSWVEDLLKASSAALRLSEIMVKTLKEISVEREEV